MEEAEEEETQYRRSACSRQPPLPDRVQSEHIGVEVVEVLEAIEQCEVRRRQVLVRARHLCAGLRAHPRLLVPGERGPQVLELQARRGFWGEGPLVEGVAALAETLACLCACAGNSHGRGVDVEKVDTLCGRGESLLGRSESGGGGGKPLRNSETIRRERGESARGCPASQPASESKCRIVEDIPNKFPMRR